MIIRTEAMLEASKFFKALAQRTPNNMMSNLIEFDSDGSILKIKMSNGEYEIVYKIESDEVFKCVISSDLFLDLIPKITSETLEFEVRDEYLTLIGSGTYKFPAIITGDKVNAFSNLGIETVTNTFSVDGDFLNSIFVNNTKQISLYQPNELAPVQRLYYLDKDGAITFTSGACVNEFNLGAEIKLMLSGSAIKFFAFTKGRQVDVKFGFNEVANNNQPRILFSTPLMEALYILPFNEFTLSQVPVDAIRGRAHADYSEKVSLDCAQIKGIIDRVELFAEGSDHFNLLFSGNTLELSTDNDKILETVYLMDNVSDVIAFKLPIREVKSAISGSFGKHFVFKFSKDDPAVAVCYANIINLIPKVED